MAESEEVTPYTLSVAEAIVHTRELFQSAPHLRNDLGVVPGCGNVTWHHLWALQDYAERKFEADGQSG